MPPPLPLILTDASVKIGDGATPTEVLGVLDCVTNHVELSPDTAVTTVDTLCGSTDYPGITKWSLVLTLIQSFDVGATEDILSKAVNAPGDVAFEILGYKSKPISATNPKWKGRVNPAPYAPINGDAGDTSTIELEWGVVGEPVKQVTPTVMAAYEEMSLAELQAAAEERGLSTSGTKAEIAARLTEAEPAAPAEA